MDLGIRGRKAIVCAASAGLGRACALAREGVDLVINARRPDVLEATAQDIRRQTGAAVTAVPADITRERLAQHLWNHRDELFTFLRQPGLEATTGSIIHPLIQWANREPTWRFPPD